LYNIVYMTNKISTVTKTKTKKVDEVPKMDPMTQLLVSMWKDAQNGWNRALNSKPKKVKDKGSYSKMKKELYGD